MRTLKTIKTSKIIGWITGIILLTYVIVSLAIYFFQEKVIFQSTHLSRDYQFEFDQPFEEFFIPTQDGDTLNALLFKTSLPSKGLILYFHGNADNLQRWGQYAVDFTSLGYDILMPDYRGYGKSTGVPGEQLLYKDAFTVLRWTQDRLPTARLILYGRSLGSAVASQLATKYTPYLLILETPFDDLEGTIYAPFKPVLQILPLQHHFPNKSFLAEVSCNKIIIHGTSDMVVPLSSALRLKPFLNSNDKFIIVEGGGHRNLRDFEDYHKALREALE